MEWTIHAFSFPAEAGPHLPTLEGWKAKLAWVADYIPRQMSGTGKWTQTQSPIHVQTGSDLTLVNFVHRDQRGTTMPDHVHR